MEGLSILQRAKDICESDETDKLKELIADFMSNSNGKRSDAKSIFEICTNKPNLYVLANKLYRVLSSSLDLNSGTISAILLSKSLINKSSVPFLSFPDDMQLNLKRDLLNLVDTSVDSPTRPINKELCHTISTLAASLLPLKKWPEFLPFFFQLVTSDKKRALLIGAHLAQYLGKGLKELRSVNLNKEFHSVLLQCLKTTTEGEDVRIAVLGAAINFILCLEQKDLVNFQDLLAAMMSTLKNALCSGNETMADAVNTLKLLISLAGMKPMFLRKQIVEMVETILLMANDHSSEKETKRLTIEFALTLVQFVLTLAEVEKSDPRQLKLGTEFEINMEEMWDDNEETDNYASWQECVVRVDWLSDRNVILIVALKVLPAYLAAPKGKKRHAAVIALSKSIIKWNCRECLVNEREWDVRVAALGASINFIPCPDLLTLMKSMLEDALEDRDEAAASEVLDLLTELVEPRFLVGQIMEWVNRMWQIANNDSLNVGTRRLAIVLLLKLAEVEEIALWLQQNVRKLFEFLINTLDHINDDDPNADYMYAWERSNHWNRHWKTCLDKLFIAVIRDDMFSIVLEVLQAYLKAPEWQKKYSAFIVLAQSIERAYLKDPEWQKKYSAFIVLAQSIESCRETQVMIEQVVPMVLSPFPNGHHHVQCAAIKAIQKLLEHLLHFRLHEEVMRTNFELVMSKLLSLFQDGNPIVQNASIHTIEELAWTLGEHLQVGCHLVLPALGEVMNDSPNQDMRGSAASIILDLSEYCTEDNLKEHLEGSIRSCLIVSKKVKEFLRRFPLTGRKREWYSLLEQPWEERLSKAWKELWTNEERDFSAYLEILMLRVFRGAQLDSDVIISTDDTWHHIFNREKSNACHVLCFCVDELMELLFSLFDQVVDTLIPFLEWYHDPPLANARIRHPERYSTKAIRIAAASAMPKILNSVRSVVESSDPEDYYDREQYFEKLSEKVLKALEEATVAESEIGDEVISEMYYFFKKCEQVLL